MRNRGEVAGGVGGRRRREAAAGREGKGGGRRRAEAASRGELGLAEAAGAGPSASLPPRGPRDVSPRDSWPPPSRLGSPHSSSPGAQTESGATEVGL